MIIFRNYALPEWTLLDAQSHEENLLEGRTCIMHVPTRCIIEMIAMDDVMVSEFNYASYDFTFTNKFGITEKHKAAIHPCMQEDIPVKDILTAAAEWYCNYMKWEDDNVL